MTVKANKRELYPFVIGAHAESYYFEGTRRGQTAGTSRNWFEITVVSVENNFKIPPYPRPFVDQDTAAYCLLYFSDECLWLNSNGYSRHGLGC